jgi:hypothetical protein
LRGGRDCTKALRTVLTEKESLQDAISTFHLREKASQLQIDTLQSTLHKSEFYKAKKWVKGKAALQDAPQEKPFGMYVYDMPKFNIDFFNSHETEYQTECKNQIGERHIHQLFEDSPHRVMDGEVADLYFVPVYTGCYRSVMGRELQVLAVSSFWSDPQAAHSDARERAFSKVPVFISHPLTLSLDRWMRTTQHTILSKKPWMLSNSSRTGLGAKGKTTCGCFCTTTVSALSMLRVSPRIGRFLQASKTPSLLGERASQFAQDHMMTNLCRPMLMERRLRS